MTRADQEKDKYRRMWNCWQYRLNSPGERLVGTFLKHAAWEKGDSLIDVGCGTGRAAKALWEKGFRVTMLDIAPNAPEMSLPFFEACLWDLPGTPYYDWFYCTDVMEHIPPEHVDQSLYNLSEMADRGFFQIALCQDGCGDLIGERLHLTVRPHLWWLSKLTKHWIVTVLPDQQAERLVCLVETRLKVPENRTKLPNTEV